jgi:nucleolar protein 15
LHPDVWKGANKKFRKIPHEKLEREQLAAPKTEEKWQKKIDKEQKKRDKKAEKMKEIGLDMPTSVLASPSIALQQRLADQDELKQVEEQEVAPTGAIEPPNDVPKDEVAVKASKKTKKEKKGKKGKNDEPEAAPEAEKVAPAATVEPPVNVTKDDVAAKASKKSKKEKKSKKGTKDDAEAASESKPVLEPTDTAMKSDAEDRSQPQDVEDASVAEAVEEGADKGSTKKKQKLSKAERKVLNADKRAEKKAKKLAEKSTAAPELADVGDAAEKAPEETAADATPIQRQSSLPTSFRLVNSTTLRSKARAAARS